MKKLTVTKKVFNVEEKDVYDIEVQDEHHYILDNGVVSHNSGFVYASSILVVMRKGKLKEDEDGTKTSEVHGIRAMCNVVKTRYSKPFENVQIQIPYTTGMNPCSGLFDFFEKNGKLTKQGNRYKYVTSNGTEMLHFRKEWTEEKLQVLMDEFSVPDIIDTSDESIEEQNSED